MKKKLGEAAKKFKALASKNTKKAKLFILKGIVLRALAAVFVILLFILSIAYVSREKENEKNSLEKTLAYFNSLPELEEKTIWSNKEIFCERVNLKCFWGSAIPADTDLDYLVFFVNQIDNSGINNGDFSHLIDFPETECITSGKVLFKTVEKSKIIKAENVSQELLPTLPRFTFAILGDSQWWPIEKTEADEFESILEKVKDFQPELILATGDLTGMYSCGEAEKCRGFFEKWRDEVKMITPNVYPAVGNHDYENGAMRLWRDIFNTPANGPAELGGTAFSFDYKNSHFIFLNSEKNSEQLENSVQTRWMNEDLKNTDKRNIFIVNHRPNYPSESYTQKHKWETFFENNVLAFFSGHVHVFCYRQIPITAINNNSSENKTIRHFIIGNSGSRPMLVPANCEQSYEFAHFAIVSVKGADMSVKIYDPAGNELYAINLKNEHYYD